MVPIDNVQDRRVTGGSTLGGIWIRTQHLPKHVLVMGWFFLRRPIPDQMGTRNVSQQNSCNIAVIFREKALVLLKSCILVYVSGFLQNLGPHLEILYMNQPHTCKAPSGNKLC